MRTKFLISFITHERRDFLVSPCAIDPYIDWVPRYYFVFVWGKKALNLLPSGNTKRERTREIEKHTVPHNSPHSTHLHTHGPREFFDFSRTKGTTSKNKETIYYNTFKK